MPRIASTPTSRLMCSAALISALAWAAGCQPRTPATKPARPAAATRATTPGPSIVRQAAPPSIRIQPAEATLGPDDPGLQLVAEGKGPNGSRRDLTREVAWKAE